jgi:transcriptional regulator with XRE-family HTH domain
MAARSLAKVVQERIRALRAERGLTQEELCERAGISIDAVSRIEGGSRVPTLDTLQRIAGGLDVAVEELLKSGQPPKRLAAPAVRRLIALVEREPEAVQEAVEGAVRAMLRIRTVAER